LFNDLLTDAGLDPVSVRLLRHTPERVKGRTLYDLWSESPAEFAEYQSTQDSTPRGRSSFARPYWASFVVPPAGGSLFVGVYEATRSGTVPVGKIDPFTGVEVGAGKGRAYDQYQTRLTDHLAAAIGSLTIDWGSGARSWNQKADVRNKPVLSFDRSAVESRRIDEAVDHFVAEFHRMARTAEQTAAYANGQTKMVTVKNKDMDFSPAEIRKVIGDLFAACPRCALTGYDFRLPTTNPHLKMSLDRKDSSRGYEPGNVQIVTRAANFYKSASDEGDWALKAHALRQMAATMAGLKD